MDIATPTETRITLIIIITTIVKTLTILTQKYWCKKNKTKTKSNTNAMAKKVYNCGKWWYRISIFNKNQRKKACIDNFSDFNRENDCGIKTMGYEMTKLTNWTEMTVQVEITKWSNAEKRWRRMSLLLEIVIFCFVFVWFWCCYIFIFLFIKMFLCFSFVIFGCFIVVGQHGCIPHSVFASKCG